MSDQPQAGPAEPLAGLRRLGRGHGLLVVLLCLTLLGGAGAAADRVFQSSTAPDLHPRPTATRAVLSAKQLARLEAIDALLRTRASAIVHHNRRAFMSTVAPGHPGFRRREAAMFHNLRRVRFASWSYTLGRRGARSQHLGPRRYREPAWAPARFKVHYRIAAFDANPTELPQFPTFVELRGHWYLGSLSDFKQRGEVSATDLWDYAPVHVIRRKSVLVMGPRSELGTMVTVAGQMTAAIPKVDAVWGRQWARRVIVRVPSTQREMALITAEKGDLHQIAALTSSEIGSVNGKPGPVGDRVTLNPANWPKLGILGSQIVLTHELTHVATRADTGRQTPKWLSEGFADYVGFRNTGVPVTIAASELAAQVRVGQQRRQLPANRDFRGASGSLPQAYEAGWLACREIAARYGQRALVRFYRLVGTSHVFGPLAVDRALHRALGVGRKRFVSQWRAYVQAQLG